MEQYDTSFLLGFTPNSLSLATGGCFLFFFANLLFNSGSNMTVTQDKMFNIPQLSVNNTIMSAVASVLYMAACDMFNSPVISKENNTTLKFDLITMIDIVIAGCVSISGSCNNIEIHYSLAIGFIGGIIYRAAI